MLELIPHTNSTSITVHGRPEVGDILLWVPEDISSNTGCSAVYPKGGPWRKTGTGWTQEVTEDGIYGGGNCPRIDENTFECAGIRFPVDSPVRWTTTVTAGEDRVDFRIRLTNTGEKTIEKAGAAVCVKFLNPTWWSDNAVFVISGGKLRSLAELGRDAGLPNGFQAYLLEGEAIDHAFYREFWGFNEHRVDAPVMVSQHPDAVFSFAVLADRAYFVHSNPGNPCTDIMLAFGDIPAGETAESFGRIEFHPGSADSLPAVTRFLRS
jgi:hypothetical protein